MKDTRDQNSPPTVPAKAPQGGEIRARWEWVEDGVWTDRMLLARYLPPLFPSAASALETGIKGGKWFRLIDKVYAERTLQRAWEGVRSNGGSAGMDGITVARYEKDCQSRLPFGPFGFAQGTRRLRASSLSRRLAVKEHLQARTYRPEPVRRVWIDKPGGGQRPLGVPTVRDRVVQNALRKVIEPIFEATFAFHSYGFRPRRGCKDALRRVDALLHSDHHWVVDADLKSYPFGFAQGLELVETASIPSRTSGSWKWSRNTSPTEECSNSSPPTSKQA